MSRHALLVAFVACLALAPPAHAKEISELQLCGETGCFSITDRDRLRPEEAAAEPAELDVNRFSWQAQRPQSYYLLNLSFDAEGQTFVESWFYLPEVDVLRNVDESGAAKWQRYYLPWRTTLERAMGRVEPYPIPPIRQALVGAQVAPNPELLLGLYESDRPAKATASSAADWVPISLRSEFRSPWTDGADTLLYSPSLGVVERDGNDYVIVPREVRAALDPLVPPTRAPAAAAQPGAGVPWATMLGVLAALLVAALAFLALRRGRGSAPRPRAPARSG